MQPGMIPIVAALIEKGASLGTALAFMMSVVALSLPEAIILRRVLKPQLLADLLWSDRCRHSVDRLSVQLDHLGDKPAG